MESLKSDHNADHSGWETCSEKSDEALMAQVCEGDRGALAGLFRRYARLVRSVARRILRDDSEADDLLQDVFLFIHHKCKLFDRSESTARSWIVQVTYSRAIDRRRWLISRHFYTRTDLEDDALDILDPHTKISEYEQSLEGFFGRKTLNKMFDALGGSA